MPTKKSEQVMASRKAAFDQVTFLIEKGGREFLKAAAMREGVSQSDYIRSACLARAGLQRRVSAPHVTGEAEAAALIKRLQQDEIQRETHATFDVIFRRQRDAYALDLSTTDAESLPRIFKYLSDVIERGENAHLSPYQLGALRRLLANMHKI